MSSDPHSLREIHLLTELLHLKRNLDTWTLAYLRGMRLYKDSLCIPEASFQLSGVRAWRMSLRHNPDDLKFQIVFSLRQQDALKLTVSKIKNSNLLSPASIQIFDSSYIHKIKWVVKKKLQSETKHSLT